MITNKNRKNNVKKQKQKSDISHALHYRNSRVKLKF